mgnify:CR=1 FL=1
MATTKWQSKPNLTTAVSRGAYRYDDFYQLVRALERRIELSKGRSEAALVGGDGPPNKEPVRFRSSADVSFPPRAFDALREREGESNPRYELPVRFLGLTGPTGALPAPYGVMAQRQLKQRDTALADFFDLFNHRLIALYYRAWAKYRLTIQYERHTDGERDPFTRAIDAFAGQIGNDRDEARRYYSGHFARRTRPASGLEAILRDCLGFGCRVDSFVGQWLPVEAESRTRLGKGGRGQNNDLGEGVLLGKRAWDLQSKVRVRVGPMTLRQYETLLPGAGRYRSIRRLIQGYLPSHMDVELRFTIRAGETPRPLGRGLRLARTTWLRSRDGSPMDARFQLTPRVG